MPISTTDLTKGGNFYHQSYNQHIGSTSLSSMPDHHHSLSGYPLQSTVSISGLTVEADDISQHHALKSHSYSPPHKRKKRKRLQPVTANLSGTRYDIVRRMAELLGFFVTKEDDLLSYLIWNDAFVATDRITELKPYQRINHFPGMGEVTRKDGLARNMVKIQKAHPDEFNFVPKSWILPADATSLQNYNRDLKFRKKSHTFIVKPPNGAQGHGISLFKNIDKIPANEQFIVQEYIDKPLLIDGYKFDLRIYVLVTSCDPLRIFLYNDGLVRLSTERYLPPQEANLNQLYMHLTNYSINKHNDKYEKGEDVESGSKRSIRFFNEYLRRKDYNVTLLWKNISDVIIKSLIVAEPHIYHAYRMCRPASPSGCDSVCFELLGFDIIIDRKLRPWLLEINRSPSFATDEQIDLEVKSGLIEDTLRLLNIKASDKKRNMAAQKAETQKRLLRPTKRGDAAEMCETERRRIINDKRKDELKDLLSRIKRTAVRDDFENRNSGRFRRIFPMEDRHRQEKYTNLVMSSFNVFLSCRATSMQKDLQQIYSNKLKEQDVLDMLAECELDDKERRLLTSGQQRSRGPKPLTGMPSSLSQHLSDQRDMYDDEEQLEDDDDDDSEMANYKTLKHLQEKMHTKLSLQLPYRPSSANYQNAAVATSGQERDQQISSYQSSRPNSAMRQRTARPTSRAVTGHRPRSVSLPWQSDLSSQSGAGDAAFMMDKEEELTKKTLAALNEMRIKFPGKTDEEAEWILDKLHENWKYHKPRIASYWLVKLDSIKRRKVIDIVRTNLTAVLQRAWRSSDVEGLRLYRILHRVFNRLLWSHGQGLWNCFSQAGNSWEAIFSKSSENISDSEMNCCRRVVQLCRDCLLIVYQFAAEAKTLQHTAKPE